MRVEPVEMEISGESVRVVDDVRWADARVKRIAEVCADEGARRKSVCVANNPFKACIATHLRQND